MNNGVTSAIDWLGGKALSDSKPGISVYILDFFEPTWGSVITNALILAGAFERLEYKINVTATGSDTPPPTITDKEFYLTGKLSSGFDLTISNIGYKMNYAVKIGSTSTVSSTTTDNGDGTVTLSELYSVNLLLDVTYSFIGKNISLTLPLGSLNSLKLSNTVEE